jgi:peptide/nickel transport system substrate-binding protein
MGYKNEQVDDLFIKAANAASSAERAKLFSDVQKLLVEDMPVGWLIEMAFPTIHDKRLQNAVVLGTGVHAPYGDVKFA